MSIPKQKCKHDNLWAVPGTDSCVKHGGKIPQTIAEADARVEAARKRLLREAIDARRADELLFRKVEAETIASLTTTNTIDYASSNWVTDSVSKSLLRERIETKIEEFKEAIAVVTDETQLLFDNGVVHGLELTLEIIEDSYKK